MITKTWPLRKLMGWGMLVKKDVRGGGTEAMDGVLLIWVLDLSFFWLIVDVIRCFRLELSLCSLMRPTACYWRAQKF